VCRLQSCVFQSIRNFAMGTLVSDYDRTRIELYQAFGFNNNNARYLVGRNKKFCFIQICSLHFFYIRARGSFCSKFKNKLRTIQPQQKNKSQNYQ